MSSTSIINSVLSATTGSSATEIDVTAAVNAILYADRAPERLWESQQTALASQTSEINQLQSESSPLPDQLNALQDTSGALYSVSATSSDTSVLSASAVAGTAVGNHTVVVNSIATTANAYSNEVNPATSTLPSGSFTIVNSAGVASPAIPVGTNATNSTLAELAATINANSSLGVTANVITDSNGGRLSLVATTSGSAAAFTIGAGATGLTFTQPPGATGTDALLTVDGVPIVSASNTVTGAISGVTLNLASQSPGTTVNLTLTPNTGAIETAVDSFVSAYNTLITDVTHSSLTAVRQEQRVRSRRTASSKDFSRVSLTPPTTALPAVHSRHSLRWVWPQTGTGPLRSIPSPLQMLWRIPPARFRVSSRAAVRTALPHRL